MATRRRLVPALAAATASLIGAALIGAPVARADDGAPYALEPIQVQVSSGAESGPLPTGFVGLSLEYPALHEYAGSDPAAPNPLFLDLIRQLAPTGSPILRIGGNSADGTWWPLPGVIPPAGVRYSLTTGWLRVAHAVARRLNARLILDLNLAAGSSALTGAEGRALVSGVGRRYIDAFELGNEPDLYTSGTWFLSARGKVVHARSHYSPAAYIADADRLRATLPNVPLAGPALANTGWLQSPQQYISGIPWLKIFTDHRYPLLACEANPTNPMFPTIPNLLADSSSIGLAQSIAPAVAIAHQAGLLYRVDELNSAACEGKPGVSDTFASALWVLNTLFNLAAVGVDGINLHTLPGADYAPFRFTHTGAAWSAEVQPIFYGLLMFERAFPAQSHLLSVTSPAGALKAWATEAPDGSIQVLLINEDPSDAAQTQLDLPDDTRTLTETPLLAPAINATDGITIGGQSFAQPTATAALTGEVQEPQITPQDGGYDVAVPAASAVLLSTSDVSPARRPGAARHR